MPARAGSRSGRGRSGDASGSDRAAENARGGQGDHPKRRRRFRRPDRAAAGRRGQRPLEARSRRLRRRAWPERTRASRAGSSPGCRNSPARPPTRGPPDESSCSKAFPTRRRSPPGGRDTRRRRVHAATSRSFYRSLAKPRLRIPGGERKDRGGLPLRLFFSPDLFGEVVLFAYLVDERKLRFEPVDVVLLVFENLFEEESASVISVPGLPLLPADAVRSPRP